jgi:hypothetical protein
MNLLADINFVSRSMIFIFNKWRLISLRSYFVAPASMEMKQRVERRL